MSSPSFRHVYFLFYFADSAQLGGILDSDKQNRAWFKFFRMYKRYLGCSNTIVKTILVRYSCEVKSARVSKVF